MLNAESVFDKNILYWGNSASEKSQGVTQCCVANCVTPPKNCVTSKAKSLGNGSVSKAFCGGRGDKTGYALSNRSNLFIFN